MADVVVEKERSSSGPLVAIVAIVVIGFLAYMAWQYFGGTPAADTTNVEVTTPSAPIPANGQ